MNFESKKNPKKRPVFQYLLEDRMKRVELILASFQRQEIQSREESRKREMLLFGMTTELQERIDIHDAKLIEIIYHRIPDVLRQKMFIPNA